MRPIELATDTALATENYIYTLQRLKKEFDYTPDIIVILHPTSPLRTVKDIDATIQIFLENDADSVISVTKSEVTPLRLKEISTEGKLKQYRNENVILKNRQDDETLYVHNGAVYTLKPSLLLEKKCYYSENTYPYVMPAERSIDIDVQLDFDIAEFLIIKKEGK